jgi:hypothetical protein
MADYLSFKKEFVAGGGAAADVDKRWEEGLLAQANKLEEAKLKVEELKLNVELRRLSATGKTNALLLAATGNAAAAAAANSGSNSDSADSDTPADDNASAKKKKAKKTAVEGEEVGSCGSR